MPSLQRKLQMTYYKSSHKKGFTLIELLVVIAILVILVSIIAGFSASVIQGQNAKKTAYQIAFFMKNQSNKAFSERADYKYTVNYTGQVITVAKSGSATVVDRLDLPKNFNYYYINTSGVLKTTNLTNYYITDGGKVKPMSIIIANRGNTALYKVSVSGLFSIKTTEVSLYRANKGNISSTPLLTLK